MKKLIIATSLLTLALNLSTASADDVVGDTYSTTNIDSYSENVALNEEATASLAPIAAENDDIAHPPEAVNIAAPAKVERPHLSREEVATLHLNIIREHVESTKSAGMFSFLSSSSAINETLLKDINLFLHVYNDLPMAAEALFLKGRVQRKLKMEEAAAISWLQVLYEFPKSDMVFNAEQRLLLLLEKDWDDYTEQVRAIMGQVNTGDRPSRLIALINQLFAIEDKDVAFALEKLQINFLQRYPQHLHIDEIEVLLAHNLGSTDAKSGIFAFEKVLALYPYSAYLAESRLAIADLQRNRLKEYENAVSSYKALIEKHPTHHLTKNAYINLAATLEEDLRSYHEAIVVLQAIVELYPDDKVTLKALQSMAKLQDKEEDKPRQAVATLRKLATMFDGNDAIEALQNAMHIADRSLKDPMLLLEVQEQLVRDFPDNPVAPETLFDMAKMLEESDKTKSKALYRQFLQQYPQHQLASDARERL